MSTEFKLVLSSAKFSHRLVLLVFVVLMNCNDTVVWCIQGSNNVPQIITEPISTKIKKPNTYIITPSSMRINLN